LKAIIQIVQSVAFDFQNEDIEAPFQELGIDSIDLVSIRVKIEKHIGYELNPYYDINGVGLIYFAAYPVMSDKNQQLITK